MRRARAVALAFALLPPALLATLPAGCGDDGGDDGGTSDGGDGGAGDREPDLGPKDPRSCEPGGDAGTCPAMRETADTLVGVVLDGAFGSPRLLAQPVLSPGWEDAPFLLDDGSLIFSYTRADAFLARAGMPPALDPTAPARCGGPGDGWALYRATPGCDGRWYVDALPVPPNAAAGDVAAASITANGRSLYVATSSGGAPRRIAHASAPAGGPFGMLAPAPFTAPVANLTCVDDHPSVLPDGLGVIFESNRDDPAAATCTSPRRLWRVYSTGGGLGPPELLTRPECSLVRGNISPSGLELVFTVTAEQAACTLAPSAGIWRVALNGQPAPTGAATRLVRVEPPSASLTVQDGVLDASGKLLVFAFANTDAAMHIDVSLAVAEKP